MKLFETYVGEDIMYPCSPAGSSRVVSVFAGAMVAALHGSNCAIVFADVFHGALCAAQ